MRKKSITKLTSLALMLIMVLSLSFAMITSVFADDNDDNTIVIGGVEVEKDPTDIFNILAVKSREQSFEGGGWNAANGEIDGKLDTGIAPRDSSGTGKYIIYTWSGSYLVTEMEIWYNAMEAGSGYNIYFSNDGGETWGEPVITFTATDEKDIVGNTNAAPTEGKFYTINDGNGMVVNAIKYEYTGSTKSFYCDLWEIDATAYKVVVPEGEEESDEFFIGPDNIKSITTTTSASYNNDPSVLFDGDQGTWISANTDETITIELDKEYLLFRSVFYLEGNWNVWVKVDFYNAEELIVTYTSPNLSDATPQIIAVANGIWVDKIVITVTTARTNYDGTWWPRLYELELTTHICEYDENAKTDVKPATCTEAGSYKNACVNCGTEKTFVTEEAKGHELEWVTDTDATCGTAGTKHMACKNCDYKEQENTEIPATGNHEDFDFVVDQDAVCGEDGYGHYACKECGFVKDENTVIPHTQEHSWVLKSMAYANGFDKEGTKTLECSNCQKTKEEAVVAIFTALGYSVSMDGKDIIGGYSINLEVLAVYEDLNGKLKYGMFIVNVNDVETISFDEEGLIESDKAMQVFVTDKTSETVKYRLRKFVPTDSQYADLNLVFAMCVLTSDMQISFVQAEPSEQIKTVNVSGADATLEAVTLRTIFKHSEYADNYDSVFGN